MLKTFESNLKEEDLLSEGDKVVLGISGGPDSMAMLDLFLRIQEKWGLSLFVVHINHLFRGVYAEHDAESVERFCKAHGVPFYRFDFPVEELAKSWKVSFEEAGRKVRYESFEKVRAEVGAGRIAVAQNRNDQAETILMRLMRGTGLDGLRGIPVKRGPYIIRPILYMERSEIEAYCERRQLPICHDHTNDETVYTRNKIRHELIPYIESNFNERVMDGLYRLGGLVSNDLDFIESSLDGELKKEGLVISAQTPIDVTWFSGLHKALKMRLIRRIIAVVGSGLKNVSSIQIEELLSMVLENKHGKKKMISGVQFRLEYGYVKYAGYAELAKTVPGDFSLNALRKKEMSMEAYSGYTLEHGEVAVDLHKISGELSVRSRENGDSFHPLGMKGTKKLKKFFIDLKIPAIERDQIPLICDDKGIIWVVGHRLSERVKVDEKTCCVGIFKWSDGC